jgi:PLP dependent protein
MEVAEALNNIKTGLPPGIKLVAVSKTQPIDIILKAYEAGHKIFGENKVQELIKKYDKLPKDIEWHMVGHLQTNKVKFIAPFVYMIHGIDSMRLLCVIDAEAKKVNRVINCLLQVRISEEETKFGLTEEALTEIMKEYSEMRLMNIRIDGLMGMASFTDDLDQVRDEFKKLNAIFRKMKLEYFTTNNSFREISMGMSGDYQIALQEGSTIIRIGSLIFGERNYSANIEINDITKV